MNLGIGLRGSDAHTRLSSYLNDHLAGSTAAVELIQRSMRSNEGSEYEAFLRELQQEVLEDRESLREVMRRLAVTEDTVKKVAAWAGEKVGRLKLNGQLLGYSPLSRLVELEGLSLGVTGKLCLWLSMRETYGSAQLAGIDLEQLAVRARNQRQRLERVRRRAAVQALS